MVHKDQRADNADSLRSVPTDFRRYGGDSCFSVDIFNFCVYNRHL